MPYNVSGSSRCSIPDDTFHTFTVVSALAVATRSLWRDAFHRG